MKPSAVREEALTDTQGKTPYPHSHSFSGPRSKSRLCIAYRSRFLDPDTRLCDENCR